MLIQVFITSTGMMWVTLNMQSAMEKCCEPSGNFTLSREWSPWCCKELTFMVSFHNSVSRSGWLLYVCSAGIRSCRPGGIVVYSTCSLSPVQNDGVVAATLEHVWHHTGIEVVVEDIRTSINCFAPMFKFFDGCRYGNLVLPNLVSNFGPMYFSRIRRISWTVADSNWIQCAEYEWMKQICWRGVLFSSVTSLKICNIFCHLWAGYSHVVEQHKIVVMPYSRKCILCPLALHCPYVTNWLVIFFFFSYACHLP